MRCVCSWIGTNRRGTGNEKGFKGWMLGILGRNTWPGAKSRCSPSVAWNTLRIRKILTLSRLRVPCLWNEARFRRPSSSLPSFTLYRMSPRRIERRDWLFKISRILLPRKYYWNILFYLFLTGRNRSIRGEEGAQINSITTRKLTMNY